MRLRIVAALIGLAGLSGGQAQAQVETPDTASALKLTLWLEAFNSADREQIAQFSREHWPMRPAQGVDQDLAFHAQTGGFELLAIEESTETRTVALIKERGSDSVSTAVAMNDLLGERAALFAPGARYQYSNYGFVLLGAIIERACGQDYYDYGIEHREFRCQSVTGAVAASRESSSAGEHDRIETFSALAVGRVAVID